MMRLVLLALVLMVLPSCATSEDVPPGGMTGPGMKTVSSKQAPSTLIAVDGTICNVMPKKYEETGVGDTAWCDWRNRSAGPPRGQI
ncbi:MAG TPA: hypothetical protein VMM12_02175 [Longimicrobiales bacterium]|nr:hypothetical protein [Longimicrobiales bacterium]